MKIRPVGAELFRADGRTDMKLMVTFFNFANSPVKTKENEEEGCVKVNEAMK
jgi:hypothetical protein